MLTRIPAKTLILMGEKDRLLPPANDHILKFLLRDSSLKILKDAGHLFVLTHADIVMEMIETFLDGECERLDSARAQRTPALAISG